VDKSKKLDLTHQPDSQNLFSDNHVQNAKSGWRIFLLQVVVVPGIINYLIISWLYNINGPQFSGLLAHTLFQDGVGVARDSKSIDKWR